MTRVKRAQQEGIPSYIEKGLGKISQQSKESGFKPIWQKEGDKIFKSVEKEVGEVVKGLQESKKEGQADGAGVYYPNVTPLGDRKVSEARMKVLPKDYVKTDLVNGLWTLAIEILWQLEAKPVSRGFSSPEPGFSDIYEFFVVVMGREKLSDEKTEVGDIPPHRWFEAFSTLRENNLIELTSTRKFEPKKF